MALGKPSPGVPPFLYASLAALLFAAGGYFMKLSAGVTRVAPALVFVALFLGGALLQAMAMEQAEMGPVYIAVLGFEAAFALLFSVLLLGEKLSVSRLVAVMLVLAGVALLRR